MYRDRLKGVQILLSNSQAGPGRTVKQEQEEISRNHVQAFIPGSVYVQFSPLAMHWVTRYPKVMTRIMTKWLLLIVASMVCTTL